MTSKKRPGAKIVLLTAVAGLLAAAFPPSLGATPVEPNTVEQRAFESAADEFGVPQPVLMATSYQLTRWEDHHGEQSKAGGYGPMHLVEVNPGQLRAQNPRLRQIADHPALHTLRAAAQLIGVPAEQLKQDPTQNIRAGAALLAARAEESNNGRLPNTLGGWYPAVAELSGSPEASGARDFADSVYEVLGQGRSRTTATGQRVAFAKIPEVVPNRDLTATSLENAKKTNGPEPECPAGLDCRYIPAAYAPTDPKNPSGSYGNYDTADRPKDVAINSIVIHDTESSYQSAISAFQSPAHGAAAHYVIRSSDGQVTQMVPTKDMAWQAGSWDRNMRSIGIEHEGWAAEGGTWYTERMYRSSAKLVKYLANRYGIPLDRKHILGHDEVSADTPESAGTEHYDPGPFWDWAHYMRLIGAPMNDEPGGDKVVTISPNFETNQPRVTKCPPKEPCRTLPAQPANFLYLRTEPRDDAPLLSSPALHPDGSPGTTEIADWSAKAVIGRQYAVAERAGDWLAIWFDGKKAWLRDPGGRNTAPAEDAELVTPLHDTIPTFGMPAPAPDEYPSGIEPTEVTPLPYKVRSGQVYVTGEPVTALDYYVRYDGSNAPNNHTVIEGTEKYVPISYNHRWVYVRESDLKPA